MIDKPHRSESEQIAFFSSCREKFEQAAARAKPVRKFFNIAGTSVCLNFSGSSLLPWLTPAIAHLLIAPVKHPDITINLWDTMSTGISAPPPPCEWADFTDRGDIWGFNSKRIKTAFHWSEYSVNVLDLKNNTGFYWVKNPRKFPYWVASSPLRTMIHWWLEKNGGQLLHAAAVGTKDGAVLITGKGGVGKSSSALACLNAGMFYLGDDYVIIKKDPAPEVYSLYNSAKLIPGDLKKFPLLNNIAAGKIDKNQEKKVLFLYPDRASQLKDRMNIRALLTPQIHDQQKTHIQPASFWAVQRAMSFTTMSQLPGVGSHTHRFINDFTNNLPCYNILLGSDRGSIPQAIREFLQNPEQLAAKPENKSASGKPPLISVIMPVFNGEKFIKAAVENVYKQNYPALELIIVDDGSTDRSQQIIENLPYDIRYFRQVNSGPAAARNRGIRDASGSFIAFLDVDDLWPENNLSHLMEQFFLHPELMVVRGYAQLFTENEQGVTEYIGNPKESFSDYIGAGIYRKEAFASVGLYDNGMRFGEDQDWFNRAREQKLPMKRLGEITLLVRRHEANMTRGKNLLELNTLKIFQKSLARKRGKTPEKAERTPPVKKQNNNLVSVIIPVFNGEHFIEDAIESVLKNDYRPLEIIVVDDGSTDHTAHVVKNIPGNIKYFYQKNQGVAAARNRGIKEASGDFIGFVDADDFWHQKKLPVQIKIMEKNPGVDVVIGFQHHIPLVKNPEIAIAETKGQKGVFTLSVCGSLMRKNVFSRVGYFDEAMLLNESADWFFRARESGVKVFIHKEPLYYYRMHQQNLTANPKKANAYMLKAYKKSIDRRRKSGKKTNLQLPRLDNIDAVIKFWQSNE